MEGHRGRERDLNPRHPSVSQVLTLFTTPVIYLWFGRIARFMARLQGAPETNTLLPEAAYSEEV